MQVGYVSKEIQQLKTKIEKHMKDAYLDLYIKKPFISEDKLLILQHLFNLAPAYREKSSDCIITAMLVQAALDTHDTIETHNRQEIGEQADRPTQLTVLAGDYYSGLYYYLLANAGDVAFIRLLASAIKEINELKIKLYHLEQTSFSTIAPIIGKIEIGLIARVAEFLQVEVDLDAIQKYLSAMLFLEEKEKYLQTGSHAVYDLWHTNKGNDRLAQYLNDRDSFLNGLLDDLAAETEKGNSWMQPLYAKALHLQHAVQN